MKGIPFLMLQSCTDWQFVRGKLAPEDFQLSSVPGTEWLKNSILGRMGLERKGKFRNVCHYWIIFFVSSGGTKKLQAAEKPHSAEIL